MKYGVARRAALAVAWWVDGLAHRVIQWLDPVSDEDVRKTLDMLRELRDRQEGKTVSKGEDDR